MKSKENDLACLTSEKPLDKWLPVREEAAGARPRVEACDHVATLSCARAQERKKKKRSCGRIDASLYLRDSGFTSVLGMRYC